VADDFALLFDRLLQARRISVRDFARRSGLAWSFIHRVRKGLRIPPLDRLEAWADLLALKGRERQRFLDLAHWSHIPPEVRPWLRPRLKRPVDEPAP
jgi:transcriptional regulator with XRE-family HTH domain